MEDRDFNKKDGQWFPIMNSLAEKLITYELTKIEHRVMWMFFRFCYGYQNSTCELRWTDMLDITQLPESSLAKALKGLKSRNILHTTQTESKSYASYKINSKLSTWTPPTKDNPKNTKTRLRTFTDVQDILHKRRTNTPQTEPLPIKDKIQRQVDGGDAATPDKNQAELEKLRSTIWELASELVKRKIFVEAKAFVGKMLKIGKNEKAVYHTLQRCYQKQVFEGGNAWGYAAAIMAEENGNYNEREFVANAQAQKEALADFANSLESPTVT